MIKVEHVTKVFKDSHNEVLALKDINLKLPDTGMVFILGKSGSGKSTLLNLVANFDKPTSGKIYFNNIDVTNFRERKRDKYLLKNVGFIFQAYNLFETLTVKENIALGLKTNYKKIEEKIDSILEEVHLKGLKNKLVKNLSGGQKQRVAIARALIKDPEIILGDEPCGNLDNVNSQIVLNILKKRSEKSLVVIVSHNVSDAYKYASRVITLNKGEVLSDRVFNEESEEKSKDYVLINDLSLLHTKDCDTISKNIRNRKVKGFYPRKEFFVDFDDSSIVETRQESKKVKRQGFLKSFFANIKLIHTKKYKYLSFSLIAALSLGIFTACLALTDFNPNDFFVRNAKDLNLNPIKYIKGYESVENEITYTDLSPLTEKDLNFIDKNFEGEYFPRYRLCFETCSTNSGMKAGKQPSYPTIKSFYTSASTGLVVTNEEHLKRVFEVDEIEYLAKLEEPIKNGIYITDYFADSLMYFNSSLTSYDKIIKTYKNSGHGYYLLGTNPINGIIKTNYGSKCKLLKDAYENGATITELTSKTEYVQILTYMLDALCTVYSYNTNFITEDLNSGLMDLNCALLEKESNQVFKEFGNAKVFYNGNLPAKTIMIPKKFIGSNFPNLSTPQIEEAFKVRNFVFRQERINSEFILVESTSFDVNIMITENHNDLLESNLKNFQLGNICISQDLYRDLKKKYSFQFGVDFDEPNVFHLNEKFNEYNLMCDNFLTKYSRSVGSYIVRFRDIFRIFYFFCMILSLFILVYYAISTIKDNAYNIGVLKSLGYRGNELGVFYFFSFFMYSLITSGLFSLSYFLLSKLVNEVMVTLVARGFQIQAIEGMPDVIAFDYRLFLGVTILLFLINLIFSFVYLFKLRKNKIAKVIQNKD